MKLEVGKKYKDQFGLVFKIISNQASHPYKYVGESIPRGALVGFTYDGKPAHCSGELVEEVREPQKFETIRYAVTDNHDNYASSGTNVANMVGYSTAKRVHPEQVKVKIIVEEIDE